MAMTTSIRLEMGVMAGILASIVMTVTVIVVTALGFLSIQWFPWVASVLGYTGVGAWLGEVGVAWFFALTIVVGLIFAFVFRQHDVYKGLGFGAIAWFVIAIYLASATAPQLSGNLSSIGIVSSIELLLPLAVCFGLWGLVMGYVAQRYLV